MPVSLTHRGKSIVIDDPAITSDIFSLIDQNTGHSGLLGVPFSARFSREEAVTLCVLLDLERTGQLMALAQETAPENMGFELDQITARAMKKRETFQSLAFVYRSLLGIDAGAASGLVKEGLSRLVVKGTILKEGTKYCPAETLWLLSGRFPVIDSILTIEAMTIGDDKKVTAGRFISLQAGVNDLLYFESDGNEVAIRSITGLTLLELVSRFLSKPPLAALETGADRGVSGTSISSCPQCGSRIKPGQKFCNYCGSKIV
jgi:hypothetical protein